MTSTSTVLNSGATMPKIGLGLWQISDENTQQLVEAALERGYRSFDTAASYRNERGLGAAIAATGIPRNELFVTTKLWNADHGTEEAVRAFDGALERLGLDRIDLFLIHWPLPMRGRYVETWQALEKLQADGRTRSIGVSNFTSDQLRILMTNCSVVPAVNQVELHPIFPQQPLRDFQNQHGIATQAWSPLGSGQGLLDLPELVGIGQAHGRSPAQIVIRWHLQRGHLVIPKSANPDRLSENLDAYDFSLDDVEMAKISALDSGRRWGPDPDTFDYG